MVVGTKIHIPLEEALLGRANARPVADAGDKGKHAEEEKSPKEEEPKPEAPKEQAQEGRGVQVRAFFEFALSPTLWDIKTQNLI
jgi:hypothetical protein